MGVFTFGDSRLPGVFITGESQINSPVYSLPGSRDFSVYSTKGTINFLAYLLPGGKKFDSPVYSLSGNQNSPVYQDSPLNLSEWSRFYSFELFYGLAMAFQEAIIKKLTMGEYFYRYTLLPISKRPMVEMFISPKPFRLTPR